MQKLKNCKKITLSTLKSFAKRNKDELFCKELSSFDGMIDCVSKVEMEWQKTTVNEKTGYYRTGIQGIYTVGGSRDYFTLFENNNYIGIEVYNCCGNSILAVKKTVEFINFRDYLK